MEKGLQRLHSVLFKKAPKRLQGLSNTDAFRNIFFIFIFVSIVLWVVADRNGFYLNEGWFNDVLVEAHGMWFDILVLGLVLTLLSVGTERNQNIQRYNEEIEDFLGWNSDEAAYRITGNVRRLQRLGVNPNTLARAYLQEMDLQRIFLKDCNLCQSILRFADLRSANLSGTDLSNADLSGADLSGATLTDAILTNAILRGAILEGADMRNARLVNADLRKANLRKAKMSFADLSGANMRMTQLTETKWFEVNLTGTHLSTVEGLSEDDKEHLSVHRGALIYDEKALKEVRDRTFRDRFENINQQR